MVSIACGVAAALCWGSTTLLMASAARVEGARGVSLWFVAYQAAVALVGVVVTLGSLQAGTAGLLAAAGGGVCQGLGTLVYMRALRIGKVGIAGPLASLEGVFAALLGVAAGERLPPLVAMGVVLAFLGGSVAAFGGQRCSSLDGSTGGLVAGALYGVTLWLIAAHPANIWLSLLVINVVSLVILGVMPAERIGALGLPRAAHPRLLAAGMGSCAGFAVFALGARTGSLVVTAVLAAQFSVVALAGAFLLMRERVSRLQLGGVLVLVFGVSLVAAGE